jgi:hypothetical protein
VLGGTRNDAGPLAFSGEVWTDARRYAMVALPPAAQRLHAGLRYELRPFTPGRRRNHRSEFVQHHEPDSAQEWAQLCAALGA